MKHPSQEHSCLGATGIPGGTVDNYHKFNSDYSLLRYLISWPFGGSAVWAISKFQMYQGTESNMTIEKNYLKNSSQKRRRLWAKEVRS